MTFRGVRWSFPSTADTRLSWPEKTRTDAILLEVLMKEAAGYSDMSKWHEYSYIILDDILNIHLLYYFWYCYCYLLRVIVRGSWHWHAIALSTPDTGQTCLTKITSFLVKLGMGQNRLPCLIGGLEQFLFFHSVGNFIIPTDWLIFFRGVGSTTNQSLTIMNHHQLSFIDHYHHPLLTIIKPLIQHYISIISDHVATINHH